MSPKLLLLLLVDHSHSEGHVITPPQTTLLKLADSFIIQAQTDALSDGLRPPYDLPALLDHLMASLLPKIFKLFRYATLSLAASVGLSPSATQDDYVDNKEAQGAYDVSQSVPESGSDFHELSIASGEQADSTEHTDSSEKADSGSSSSGTKTLQKIDVVLPRVCEAIVLIIQCFCNLILEQGTDRQLTLPAKQKRELLCGAMSPEMEHRGLIESIICVSSSGLISIESIA